MQIQNRLTVDRCRELVGNSQRYSDFELEDIRNRLYRLAEVVVERFEKIKSFITRSRTVEARARIVQ